jgi:uncharacterized protein YceH (UPF0502 family)
MSDSERGWWREERVELNDELTAEEVRVVGCLMEKEATTPEYYPLTLNALVTACNQTSNRDPVVSYDAGEVTEALDHLRELKLIRVVHPSSGRAIKYRHVLDEALSLDDRSRAVLTVLMLRGPQTLGELRTRTERMHPFETTAEVESVLDALAGREPALVVRLERQPGQKEARSAHLLAGEPDVQVASSSAGAPSARSATAAAATATAERIEALEERVAALEATVEDLLRQL